MAERKNPARYEDIPGNQTAGTPDVDESELAELRVDELRSRAQDLGVSGTSEMRKDQLVEAVAKASGQGRERREDESGDGGGA
ncbi:Rho termination factor N-terminal domain-containing protein [Nonomuraea wenchangensis]